MKTKSKVQLQCTTNGNLVTSYIFGTEKAHPLANLWGQNCNTDKRIQGYHTSGAIHYLPEAIYGSTVVSMSRTGLQALDKWPKNYAHQRKNKNTDQNDTLYEQTPMTAKKILSKRGQLRR